VCDKLLKHMDNLKTSLRMLIISKFEKSSNYYSRVRIADKGTFNYKDLSLLDVGYRQSPCV
jgi:hypothetical protein